MIRLHFFSFVICLNIFSSCQIAREPVTGERAFFVTNPEQEKELGNQAFQEITQKMPIIHYEEWDVVVERVGHRVVASAQEPNFEWSFAVAKSQAPNALALPNGSVLVTTGMMSLIDTEAELAAVIGHEIAHVTARHAGQRIAAAYGANLSLSIINSILERKDIPQRSAIMAILGVGANLGAMLPFSREMENDADIIGLHYMASAGYAPEASIKLWQKMLAASDDSSVPVFLRTHPHSKQRIATLQSYRDKVFPLYQKSPRYGMGANIPEIHL